MSEGLDFFDLPGYAEQEALLALQVPVEQLDSSVPNPIARVALDISARSVDQLFDFSVPARLSEDAVPGSLVRVEFSHREVEGYIIERTDHTSVAGLLRPIVKVVSRTPALSPELYPFYREVARDHLAPTASILRAAIPPRHVRGEREFLARPEVHFRSLDFPRIGLWETYQDGSDLVRQMGNHRYDRSPLRLVLNTLAHHDPRELLASAVGAQLYNGSSVLILVPTPAQAHDYARYLSNALGNEPIGILTSELSSQARYENYLSAKDGRVRVLVGTQSALWAPLKNLGMIAIVDSAHAAFTVRRSPYVDAGPVALARAQFQDCDFLAVQSAPSLELAFAEKQGDVREITAASFERANSHAQFMVASDFAYENAPWSRMPDAVFSVTRAALSEGSVLFVVPNPGYVPMLACARCQQIAQCTQCGAALEIPQPDAVPQCSRCAHKHPEFTCPNCSFTRLRAVKIGSMRTAQEVGRAFPGVSISLLHDEKPWTGEKKAGIVVASPSSLNLIEADFQAAVILDAGYLLRGKSMTRESTLLRTLVRVGNLVLPRRLGGKVLLVGDIPRPLSAVFEKWDFSTWTQNELEARESAKLPPAYMWYEISGPWQALRQLLATVRGIQQRDGEARPFEQSSAPLESLMQGGVHHVVSGAAILGPHPVEGRVGRDEYRIYLRMSHESFAKVNTALRTALAQLDSTPHMDALRIKLNPIL